MTATLCPVFQDSQFTSNGEFLVGGLLWFYEAGSSTLATAYTTNSGNVAWSNPIVLDSRGETGGTIWLDPALSYRIVLESKPFYGQTHGVVITEHDDITGVPVAVYAEEWVAFAGVPTYVSTTSFTVLGDFRDVFVADRKLLITSASVETIHSVTSSSFGSGGTTVNVTGSINSSIATVAYSFITPDASPDRFENVTVTNDLTVSGDTVLDGNATIGGNLNSVPIANWWNNTNNVFGTSISPDAGSIIFANGIRFYRETFTVSWPSGTTAIDATKSFAVPMPTACLQVVACLGNIADIALDNYSPIVFISSLTVDGFNYSLRSTSPPVSTTTVQVRIIAIGY